MQRNFPEVYITVNKDRRKKYQYRDAKPPVYYLKNGEEFEFEFFNPTSDVFLAEISLNGKSISNSGLILKPGERIFLDRYLDDKKKFKFETYEVEDTLESKKAIEKNGEVVVKFRKEKTTIDPPFEIDGEKIGATPLLKWDGPRKEIFPRIEGTCNSNITRGSSMGSSITHTNTNGNQVNCCSYSSSEAPSLIETGRVQKGSNSNQVLEQVSGYSGEYAIIETRFRILPESQLEKTSSDMRIYCTGCGRKRHGSDKFCGQCGTRF